MQRTVLEQIAETKYAVRISRDFHIDLQSISSLRIRMSYTPCESPMNRANWSIATASAMSGMPNWA